jgi:hypothetical protein
MSLTIIDRFRPAQRKIWQAASDEGRLHEKAQLELFDMEQMLPMARLSLLLLVLSGLFFVALNLVVYIWQTGHHSASLSWGLVLLWLAINLVAYVVVLPLHELIHALAFWFWGGRPYFGTKLPMALYCSAKDQVFPRNYYLVVGLAPLVVITLAGCIFTLLAPTLAPYALFALVGNASGAAGDLWVSRHLRQLPATVLIEDLETGYRAWEMTTFVEGVTTITPEV